MRDPRLALLSINALELSGDTEVAKIYWSILGESSDEAIAEAEKAIEGSLGFLRKKIASQLSFRVVPDLRFTYDKSVKVGGRIDELLASLKK